MKKLVCLLLAILLLASLTACQSKPKTEENWKIAIMTGTVSQGEEEFRAAEKAVATYGKEHVITATYPDNFMS